MNADLQKLIQLQQLETATEEARRKIADHPRRVQELDDRLQAARDILARAKARLADALTSRRAEEKEVAAVQTRLAKYKDQLLEVKTNREYQAMLHEIETAQNDIRAREDRILEAMMTSDELSALVKNAESDLKAAEKEISAERLSLEREMETLQGELSRAADIRADLTKEIPGPALAIFERVAKGRKGLGMAEARGGMCTICHVRLRPQVFNEVRRNEAIIQCDSCQRILYYTGDTSAPPPQS
jgi:predicted  nucleic acid-binding Zn-ribbon protein